MERLLEQLRKDLVHLEQQTSFSSDYKASYHEGKIAMLESIIELIQDIHEN